MIMKRLFPILMIVACALISPVFYPAHGANNMTIEDACAAIGLDPGEAPFAQCVQSLQRSASMPDSALAASKSGSNVAVGSGETRVGHRSEYACQAIGLDPATARYSYCVTNLRQTLFETSLPGYQN
jgi:hypothetical protein